MKVIAAYLLAVLGGKKEPTADNVNAILASVGSKAEADDVNGLIAALKGKTLQEVIDAGMKNVGGGGGGGAAAASGGAAPAAEAAKPESSSSESSSEAMEGGLFD